MDAINNFEYDSEIDSLTIYHKNFSDNKKILGSLNYGDFIFDIATDGSFVSLEIDNASQVLKSSPEILKKIKEANIKAMLRGDAVIFVYAISLENKEIENSLMIPRNKIVLPTI